MKLTSMSLNIITMITGFFMVDLQSFWLCLELNTFSFLIMLLMNNKTENLIKYFLIQMPSSLLLILLMANTELPKLELWIILILVAKMGIPPFHLWLVSIMKNASLLTVVWLLSFQKLLPLILMSSFMNTSVTLCLTFLVGLTTTLLILQIKIPSILVLSSALSNMWMISSMMSNFWVWQMYFFIYTPILYLMISCLWMKMKYMKFWNMSYIYFILFILTFFMLIPVPPSPVFFIKILILSELTSCDQLFLSLILLVSALAVAYTYFNMFTIYLMTKNNQTIKITNFESMYLLIVTLLTLIFSFSSIFLYL